MPQPRRKLSQDPSRNGVQESSGTRAGAVTGIGTAATTGTGGPEAGIAAQAGSGDPETGIAARAGTATTRAGLVGTTAGLVGTTTTRDPADLGGKS